MAWKGIQIGMIDIRPLTAFDAARFGEIAGGYTSYQHYVVRREESDHGTTFTIELEELDQPYTRQWDYDEELHSRYRQVIAEQGLSLGAYDGDLLIGVAIAERRDWNRSLWVWEFHIHPDYRGQGIGRRLMDALADRARRAGLCVIVCETQNTNVPAIRFYRRVGFELDGIDLSYYPPEIDEIAFFMKCKLSIGRI